VGSRCSKAREQSPWWEGLWGKRFRLEGLVGGRRRSTCWFFLGGPEGRVSFRLEGEGLRVLGSRGFELFDSRVGVWSGTIYRRERYRTVKGGIDQRRRRRMAVVVRVLLFSCRGMGRLRHGFVQRPTAGEPGDGETGEVGGCLSTWCQHCDWIVVICAEIDRIDFGKFPRLGVCLLGLEMRYLFPLGGTNIRFSKRQLQQGTRGRKLVTHVYHPVGVMVWR
jgi:hypothetical protein